MRNPARPRLPATRLTALAGPRSPDAADPLRWALAPVFRVRSSPWRGGAARPQRSAPCLARPLVPLERSGTSLQVPEAEPVVSFPAPGKLPSSRSPPPPVRNCAGGGGASSRSGWKGGHPFPHAAGGVVGCPVAPLALLAPPSLVGGCGGERRPLGGCLGASSRSARAPPVAAAAASSSRAPHRMRGPGEASAWGWALRRPHRALPIPPPCVLGRDRPGHPPPSPVAADPATPPRPPASSRTACWWPGVGGAKEPGLRATPPSAGKPSLAIREGALGYRSPQPPPLLCACSWPVAGPLPAPCGCGGPPSDGCSPGLLRPAPPPSESGEGHAGPGPRVPWRGRGRG